jgi:hypothetical protein
MVPISASLGAAQQPEKLTRRNPLPLECGKRPTINYDGNAMLGEREHEAKDMDNVYRCRGLVVWRPEDADGHV